MLGIHFSKKTPFGQNYKSLHAAIDGEIARFGPGVKLNVAQIFTHGPRNRRASAIDEEKIRALDVPIFVHGCYPSISIWNLRSAAPDDVKKSLDHLAEQLDICDDIGAQGLILHLPKRNLSVVESVLLSSRVGRIVKDHKTSILFEIVPDKDKTRSYAQVENLNKLCPIIAKNLGKKGAICIDTAHLWGSGIDVGEFAAMQKYLDDIKYPEMIKLFHVNGSEKATFGAGRDEHYIAFGPDDDLFGGHKPDKSGLAALAKFARKYDVPIICEINRGESDDAAKSLLAISGLLGVRK